MSDIMHEITIIDKYFSAATFNENKVVRRIIEMKSFPIYIYLRQFASKRKIMDINRSIIHEKK